MSILQNSFLEFVKLNSLESLLWIIFSLKWNLVTNFYYRIFINNESLNIRRRGEKNKRRKFKTKRSDIQRTCIYIDSKDLTRVVVGRKAFTRSDLWYVTSVVILLSFVLRPYAVKAPTNGYEWRWRWGWKTGGRVRLITSRLDIDTMQRRNGYRNVNWVNKRKGTNTKLDGLDVDKHCGWKSNNFTIFRNYSKNC